MSERWPQMIRIVLSGSADLEQTTRLVPYAHQYLSKPCAPQQLENVIERCLRLHDLLNEQRLRSIVGRIRNLPSLPGIYVALQSMVKDESVTLGEVARVVAADTALAARVLQIVNSAFLRLARRITSIEQAVSYLGFKSIRNLAMAVEIFSRWPKESEPIIAVTQLQAHVQTIAAACTSLTAKTPYADDAMLAGLLHDIGYLVLAKECSGELRTCVDRAISENIPLYVVEQAVIGASHAEIGAYLLGIWGLPYPIVEAVAHHHEPHRVHHPDFDVLAALAISQAIAQSDDASVFPPGVPPDPRVGASYLQSFNAPFDWNEAERRIAEATNTNGTAA